MCGGSLVVMIVGRSSLIVPVPQPTADDPRPLTPCLPATALLLVLALALALLLQDPIGVAAAAQRWHKQCRGRVGGANVVELRGKEAPRGEFHASDCINKATKRKA